MNLLSFNTSGDFYFYRMKKLFPILFSLVSCLASAQQAAVVDSLKKDAVNVFLDCQWCDADFFRKQITFVNYVRERKEADVHILITSQTNGSGGESFSFLFIGQKKFAGINDTLVYTSKADATDDETREGQAAVLKMGLIRYVSKTPFSKYIEITMSAPSSDENVKDKWRNWVFNLDASGYFNGQEASKSLNSWSSINANKITEDWKVEFHLNANYSESRYQIDDTTEIKSVNTSKKFEYLLVKSINDHWSAGGFAWIENSTFNNLDLSYTIAPSVEYNLFKYSEATRKQLRFLYGVGYSYRDYTDTTIYNKTEETLFGHRLSIGLEAKQKWGSIETTLIGSNYFHDFSLNNVQLREWLNLRLFKGFSIRLGGSVSFIHDQISLPKSGASLEEILLQQRQLATAYSFWGNFGISYTFGSIYSNVVNPRFGN